MSRLLKNRNFIELGFFGIFIIGYYILWFYKGLFLGNVISTVSNSYTFVRLAFAIILVESYLNQKKIRYWIITGGIVTLFYYQFYCFDNKWCFTL